MHAPTIIDDHFCYCAQPNTPPQLSEGVFIASTVYCGQSTPPLKQGVLSSLIIVAERCGWAQWTGEAGLPQH